MESLRELLAPKTVNKFSFTANVFWLVLGVVLSSVFLEMENNEPRFHCDAKDDQELIQGKCYEQYEKRFNKLSIPVYAFVLFNFFTPMIACGIYSQYVKSRISELEQQQQPLQPRQGSPPRKLFKAYCFQLVVRFLLGILCISLQKTVFYPQTFPSNFICDLMEKDQPSENITQTQTYECHNQRATYKNFWTYAVIVVNGIFAFLVLMEIFYILTRVMKKRRLVEDFPFYAFHLRSHASVQPEQLQQQSPFQVMKDNIIKETERLRDLQSPFRPNPGEGNTLPKDLKIDQIYTNLIIHEGRVEYDFPEDRQEQLNVYPKPNENSPLIQPRDIIDAHHKNVLVVGRPGIGKSLFCIKLLRDWASDTETENSQLNFEAVFLLKFRRMNSIEKPLTLRELLAFSEYSLGVNEDAVWKFVLENPTKALLIFDGLDEFKFKMNIAECSDSDQPNDVTAKMSFPALYNKIASGKLLGGATVLTTTRPNAVSFVKHLDFDRTVEILGFTSEQVEDYVNKFTADEEEGTGRTIWQHISSNLNIFSMCYVPVNCFIICTCLLHVLQTLKSNVSTILPTKLTEIYSIAIKMFYFKHSRNDYKQYQGQADFIREKFENLPGDVKDHFKLLGEIAFTGIKEGRLIFESKEVEGLEDCGLLHRLPDLCASADNPFEKPKPQFCFIHLTIQEFLAAKHVVDTMSGEELRRFVHCRIKQGTWHLVLQFVAGLLGFKGEESLTRTFVDALPLSTERFNERERKAEFDDDKVFDSNVCSTLIFWPLSSDRNLVVALSMCLYEIDVDDPILQTKLRQIGFNAADFSNCQIGPVECLGLVNLLNSHSVISLDLTNNNLGPLGCKQIQPLLAISDKKCNDAKLRGLNRHGNRIEDEGVRHLTEAITHSNCKLNSLNLSRNSINDEGVKHLAKALTHSNCKLNSLNFSSNNISIRGVKHLAEALTQSNGKLNSLNLSFNIISEEGVKHLAEALTHSNCKLNSLHLSCSGINEEGVKHLAEALIDSNCKLSSLNLSSNYDISSISDEVVKHLAKALTHSNCKLNSLNFSSNNISIRGVKHLAEALTQSNGKLNSLNLSFNIISEEGAKHLAKALTHSNCKLNSLHVSRSGINEEGVKHLAEALTHSDCKLNSLNLSSNIISDEGVKHLAKALTHSNCKLNSLDLFFNFRISNEGAKHLAEALTQSNCKLNSLNLSPNTIGDEGVKHLAEALTYSNCKLNTSNLPSNK